MELSEHLQVGDWIFALEEWIDGAGLAETQPGLPVSIFVLCSFKGGAAGDGFLNSDECRFECSASARLHACHDVSCGQMNKQMSCKLE